MLEISSLWHLVVSGRRNWACGVVGVDFKRAHAPPCLENRHGSVHMGMKEWYDVDKGGQLHEALDLQLVVGRNVAMYPLRENREGHRVHGYNMILYKLQESAKIDTMSVCGFLFSRGKQHLEFRSIQKNKHHKFTCCVQFGFSLMKPGRIRVCLLLWYQWKRLKRTISVRLLRLNMGIMKTRYTF